VTFDNWWNIFGCNSYPEDWKGALMCGWDNSVLYSQAPSFTEEQVRTLEQAQAILSSQAHTEHASVLLQLARIAREERSNRTPAAAR
jgi:hypothetical protein